MTKSQISSWYNDPCVPQNEQKSQQVFSHSNRPKTACGMNYPRKWERFFKTTFQKESKNTFIQTKHVMPFLHILIALNLGCDFVFCSFLLLFSYVLLIYHPLWTEHRNIFLVSSMLTDKWFVITIALTLSQYLHIFTFMYLFQFLHLWLSHNLASSFLFSLLNLCELIHQFFTRMRKCSSISQQGHYVFISWSVLLHSWAMVPAWTSVHSCISLSNIHESTQWNMTPKLAVTEYLHISPHSFISPSQP